MCTNPDQYRGPDYTFTNGTPDRDPQPPVSIHGRGALGVFGSPVNNPTGNASATLTPPLWLGKFQR